jgi:hypothetical protein
MYHESCWIKHANTYQSPSLLEPPPETECPECKGFGVVACFFRLAGEGNMHATHVTSVMTFPEPNNPTLWQRTVETVLSRTQSRAQSRAGSVERSTPMSFAPQSFGEAHSQGSIHTSAYVCGTSQASEIPDPNFDTVEAFHSSVRLSDGRMALVADIGSKGNLAGEEWATQMSEIAAQHGYKTTKVKRARPLTITGVGKGDECAQENWSIPCSLDSDIGAFPCQFNTPVVPNSGLPALLGLQSLKHFRAVIDCESFEIYFPGPGKHKHQLTPGTRTVKAEYSPSGHMLIPCDEFAKLLLSKAHDQPQVALATQQE